MQSNNTIHVIDSWDLTSIGIVAELKHSLNGLRSGLIIKSQSTGSEWRIKKRVLYNHTHGKQKTFANETTTQCFLSFTSIEEQVLSSNSILEKEEDHIFQYQLQPVGHNLKPLKDEMLVQLLVIKYACPCCGYKTFEHEPNGSYNICNVCFWEDDLIQLDDPDYEGGANRVSLRQAQKNFQKFGACEEDMKQNVREPDFDEARDENWTWLK